MEAFGGTCAAPPTDSAVKLTGHRHPVIWDVAKLSEGPVSRSLSREL